MAGTPDTTSRFVQGLKSNGLSPELLTISFVNADALGPMLRSHGAGLVVSQVVPMPNDKGSALVKQIQELNRALKVAPGVGFSVIEGYVMGRTICETLRAIGESPTRGKFLSELFGKPCKVGVEDYVLEFGPSKNSGSDRVYLSQMMPDGTFSGLSQARNRASAA